MKKILVAGGAGFLGSNLCKSLLEKENKVICVDNFHTGRKENLEEIINNDNFILIETDVEDLNIKSDSFNFLKEQGINEIYNLASPASPRIYQKNPVKTIKTNVIGMMNLLELATCINAKILQASTSEVYGDPEVHPQPESYMGSVNPTGIRACYDEGKRCAETLCFDYNREFGTNIKVVRIFNTYGPNMDPQDGRVISNFIMQALNNEEITVFGDGLQTRSMCFVDDLIDGMIRMMESREAFTGPVNLGSQEEYTMLGLAEKIVKETNSSSRITFKPLPLDDPKKRRPELGLALGNLDWKPSTTFEEGLLKTIEYYKGKC